MHVQTVVIDAHGHMLGRLTSVIAKELLSGRHIVSYLSSCCVLCFASRPCFVLSEASDALQG